MHSKRTISFSPETPENFGNLRDCVSANLKEHGIEQINVGSEQMTFTVSPGSDAFSGHVSQGTIVFNSGSRTIEYSISPLPSYAVGFITMMFFPLITVFVPALQMVPFYGFWILGISYVAWRYSTEVTDIRKFVLDCIASSDISQYLKL